MDYRFCELPLIPGPTRATDTGLIDGVATLDVGADGSWSVDEVTVHIEGRGYANPDQHVRTLTYKRDGRTPLWALIIDALNRVEDDVVEAILRESEEAAAFRGRGDAEHSFGHFEYGL